MHMEEYPFLIPPSSLIGTKGRDRTKKQAKEYFDWLMSVREERVKGLLEYFGECLTGDSKADLLRIGSKVTDMLRHAPFCEYEDGKISLTERGAALAADMGLLIAALILRERPHITWGIEKRKLITYNMPVLAGFPIMNPDPIRSGIAEAHSIVQGEQDSDCWWLLFDKWMEHTSGAVPSKDI